MNAADCELTTSLHRAEEFEITNENGAFRMRHVATRKSYAETILGDPVEVIAAQMSRKYKAPIAAVRGGITSFQKSREELGKTTSHDHLIQEASRIAKQHIQ